MAEPRATSGSFYTNVAWTTGGSVAVRLYVDWWLESQDVNANTSRIGVTLKVVTYNYGQMIGSATQYWNIDVNGSRVAGGTFTIAQGSNSTKTLGTGYATIGHNSVGDASFSIYAQASFNMNFNQWVGTRSLSGSDWLPNIPRASTPTVSGTLQLGNTITIKTNRAASSFTHTIKYNVAGRQAVIAENVADSTTWKPDIATFAPLITNADYADCRIICNTYNGSQLMGTRETSFKLGVPSSIVPSVSAVSFTDADGHIAKFGAAVMGVSDVSAAITASGVYGSSISAYEAEVDGIKASGNPAHIGTLGSPGTRTVTAKATDSRGRTATKTANLLVASYEQPNISEISAARWDVSANEESDESSTVRVFAKGSAFDVNERGKNPATVTVSHRLSTEEAFTVDDSRTAGQSFDYTIDIPSLSENKKWQIKIEVTDTLGGRIIKTFDITTAQPVFDLRSDGQAMGILAVSDVDGIKMGKNLYLANSPAIYAETQKGTYVPALRFSADGDYSTNGNIWFNSEMGVQWFDGAGIVSRNGILQLMWGMSGGIGGMVRKTIWEGTWWTGDMSVFQAPSYNLFIAHQNEDSTKLLGIRENANGGGSYINFFAIDRHSTLYAYGARMQAKNGTTLNLIRAEWVCLTRDWVGTQMAITKLEGLI